LHRWKLIRSRQFDSLERRYRGTAAEGGRSR
jgi:hypothetical protein